MIGRDNDVPRMLCTPERTRESGNDTGQPQKVCVPPKAAVREAHRPTIHQETLRLHLDCKSLTEE